VEQLAKKQITFTPTGWENQQKVIFESKYTQK